MWVCGVHKFRNGKISPWDTNNNIIVCDCTSRLCRLAISWRLISFCIENAWLDSTQNDTNSAATRIADCDWDKFTSSLKVFQINFSKWMNAIYYSMKRDLNAESAAPAPADRRSHGLCASFVSVDVQRKHTVCCRWSHKNLLLFRMRILTQI